MTTPKDAKEAAILSESDSKSFDGSGGACSLEGEESELSVDAAQHDDFVHYRLKRPRKAGKRTKRGGHKHR
jgi:hypothetical protein